MNPIQWLADRLSPYRSEQLTTRERATAIAAYRSLATLVLNEPIDSKVGAIAARMLQNADIESAPYINETMGSLKALLDAQVRAETGIKIERGAE